MPAETQDAVNWVLSQEYEIEPGRSIAVSPDLPFTVVNKVREYFNTNNINYSTFSFDDLIPFLS